MKKILIVAPHCQLGGSEKGLLFCIERLIKRNNIDVTLVFTQQLGILYNQFKKLNIKIIDLSFFNIEIKKNFLIKLMLKTDVLLVSNDLLSLLIQNELKLKQLAKFKTITFLRSTFNYYVNMILNNYKTIDIIIVITEIIQEYLKKNNIIDKVILIKNGTNIEKWQREKNIKEAKKFLNIDENTIVLGYVGRISIEKNLLSLVKIFNKLNFNKKKELLIIGNYNQNEIKTNEILVKKINNNPNIKLFGYKENTKPFYEAFDLNILTSFDEGMPRTILEATACKVKTVSTNIGHISYLIPKEYLVNITTNFLRKPGEVFNKKDEENFINKIYFTLNDSNILINNCYNVLCKEFNSNINEEKIVDIIVN